VALSSELTTPNTTAPCSFAIWIAITPVPPAAPRTSTMSFALMRAFVTSMCQAVTSVSGSDAASYQSRFRGFGTTLCSWIVTQSACAPCNGPVSKPQILKPPGCSQMCSSPFTQR
jgi:hypothetical protein